MDRTETATGTITRTTRITRFEVFHHPGGGGYIQFQTLVTLKMGQNELAAPSTRAYVRDFKDLPATFPVVINGNTVQVAGSTILAALQSVADAVMSTQPQGPA